MKHYNTVEELISSELNMRTTSMIYPIFETAQRTFDEIILDNHDIFKSQLKNNILGWLRTFLVFRQFEEDMISEAFPFEIFIKKVNNFGYKAITLKGKNIELIIAKTLNEHKLPSKSKYRIKSSRANNLESKQVMIHIPKALEKPSPSFVEEPYFGFLAFGGCMRTMEHVSIIIPNAGMTEILATINLKKQFSLYIGEDIFKEQPPEKKITKLKKSVEEELGLKLKVDS